MLGPSGLASKHSCILAVPIYNKFSIVLYGFAYYHKKYSPQKICIVSSPEKSKKNKQKFPKLIFKTILKKIFISNISHKNFSIASSQKFSIENLPKFR